ncbi:MAG: hypothetical protein LUD15_12540, partial [Bacteroides sp.]|nr:hypothetical protein [Bacteroides sp.]
MWRVNYHLTQDYRYWLNEPLVINVEPLRVIPSNAIYKDVCYIVKEKHGVPENIYNVQNPD